jgi:Ras and EF-hand domain-containing protein
MNSFRASTFDNNVRMKELLRIRAFELFKLCDVENKGFINKRDMLKMQETLGLTPDMLEEVFESLDMDKNGYLTLDEFTNGFSEYFSSEIQDEFESRFIGNRKEQEESDDDLVYKETMQSLGASNLFDG